ncbi:MAG TPA: metallophosphoesterase [Tepidisphaeraceae bacterium]|jgi:3',5'-cyclic AMP phosphodiesterase CpdA|nr:metallophosphoesterase [Tepidisphaeraceae bacterium]
MRMIAHISDLHFGRLDRAVAEGLVDDLHALRPSLLVVSGDFTQRARPWQFRQAADYLKRLPSPQLIVPGNHDVPVHVIRRIFHPLKFYRQNISQELDPLFQDEEMLVVGVNTARSFTQKSGWISEAQMAQVRRRMTEPTTPLMKVLVTHHPFIPPPRHPRGDVIRGAPRYLRILENCGVDLLLAGHLHLAYNDDVRTHHKTATRSILSIQAGTATSTRRRGEPNAYNWITLSAGLVTVGVRTWNDSAFEESRVTRYRRVGHVWERDEPIMLGPAQAV